MMLFRDTESYSVRLMKTREEWLKERANYIGGSDASILVDANPWRSCLDLWRDKIEGIRSEVSGEAVDHGIAMEPIIRDWARVTYKDLYDIQYVPDTILISNREDMPFASYSPDGLIMRADGKKGVWECKTTTIRNASGLECWRDQIPEQYYLQTLWGLIVTGFDFVHLTAEIRFAWDETKVEIRNYTYSSEDAREDIEWLESESKRVWNAYFKTGTPPPLRLTI